MFGAHARKLYEKGYSIIPVKVKEKRPDLDSWDKYKTELASEQTFEHWEENKANRNIGICCGIPWFSI